MPSRSVVRTPAGTAWRLAAVLGGAVLLVVASVAGVNAWNAGVGLNVRFATIPNALPDGEEESGGAPPQVGPVPGSDVGLSAAPQNILVLGVDGTRADADGAPASNAPPEQPRAETLSGIMLVNIPASRARVSVLSILPETTVQVPEREPATLTQALSTDGVSALVEGVQGLVGARIDHVAAVDVAAIGVMTDAVGGLDPAVSDHASDRSGSSGHTEHGIADRLSGAEAVELLRAPAPPDAAQGDDPIANSAVQAATEQDVVRALLASADRKGTFRSLRETGALADDLAPFIAVDEGLTVGYLSSLQLKLRDLASDVEYGTLPASPGAPGAAASAIPDPAALADVRQAIDSDSLADYLDRVTPTD